MIQQSGAPKGTEHLRPRQTCTSWFIAALFIIDKTWKQPRCPSVGEWINLGNGILFTAKKK